MKKIITKSKLCLNCGNKYERPYGLGMKYWNTSKFCSHSCYSKNIKGKKRKPHNKSTKRKIGIANSGERNGMYGKKAWNSNSKGLTKANKGSFKKGMTPWNRDKKGITPWNKNKYGKFKNCKYCNKKIWIQKSNLKRKKFCSKKCRDLFRKGKENLKVKGKNNWNWKGGITPLRIIIWKNIKSEKWRESIFKRDNYTCQKTKTKGGTLEIHHKKSFSKIMEQNKIKTLKQALFCQELWNINNGITLSKQAHREFHKLYGQRNNTREQLIEFLKK